MLNQILGPVMFFSGSLEEYNSLSEKAPNGVYFINNTENGNRLLYLGDSLFPIHWVLIEKEDELPDPGVPDVLYISNKTNCFYYWVEDTKELEAQKQNELNDLVKALEENLAKAEKTYSDAIASAGEDTNLDAIKETFETDKKNAQTEYENSAIEVNEKYEKLFDNIGEYVVKYGTNIVNKAEFIDAFQRVSFDESTRVITIPVYKDSTIETLTINLGKDLILEDGSYYDANTRRIRLKLVTSDTSDPEEDDGYIDIPVDDLIDIYEGTPDSDTKRAVVISVKEAVNGSSVDVRTITATVNAAAAGSGKKNYLEVRDDGLYVDVESYTDGQLGDLGFNNEGTNFSTVGEGLTYILGQTNEKVPLTRIITTTGKTLEKDFELTVDDIKNAVPKSRTITSTGKNLENNIELKVEDIVGAAPIQNAVFTGSTERAPIDIHATITETGTESDSIKATEIATVKYVNDAMSVANTWGGFIQYLTWGYFVNE